VSSLWLSFDYFLIIIGINNRDVISIKRPNTEPDLSNPKFEARYPDATGPINSPKATQALNLNININIYSADAI